MNMYSAILLVAALHAASVFAYENYQTDPMEAVLARIGRVTSEVEAIPPGRQADVEAQNQAMLEQYAAEDREAFQRARGQLEAARAAEHRQRLERTEAELARQLELESELPALEQAWTERAHFEAFTATRWTRLVGGYRDTTYQPWQRPVEGANVKPYDPNRPYYVGGTYLADRHIRGQEEPTYIRTADGYMRNPRTQRYGYGYGNPSGLDASYRYSTRQGWAPVGGVSSGSRGYSGSGPASYGREGGSSGSSYDVQSTVIELK